MGKSPAFAICTLLLLRVDEKKPLGYAEPCEGFYSIVPEGFFPFGPDGFHPLMEMSGIPGPVRTIAAMVGRGAYLILHWRRSYGQDDFAG